MTQLPPPIDETDEERRRDNVRIGMQVLIGIVGFVALVAVASRLFKAPLEAVGMRFVDAFGLPGVALGVFVSDGFSSPIPPQFYLLATVTKHLPPVPSVGLVCLASVLAGHVGRLLGLYLGDRKFFLRLLAGTRKKADVLFRRYGYWAVAIGSVTPFPYSTLCHLAGLYRMPFRQFALFSLLRIPRILFYYWVLRAGFG